MLPKSMLILDATLKSQMDEKAGQRAKRMFDQKDLTETVVRTGTDSISYQTYNGFPGAPDKGVWFY